MARRNKSAERDIALRRIRRLFALAKAAAPEDRPRSDRYVRLARRIGMRYQVSVPRELRRQVCRECDALLVPGRTARVRLTQGKVAITCLRCTAVKRFPYRPAKAVTA